MVDGRKLPQSTDTEGQAVHFLTKDNIYMTDQTPAPQSEVAKVEADAKAAVSTVSSFASKVKAVAAKSPPYAVGAVAGVAGEKMLGVVAHVVLFLHKL